MLYPSVVHQLPAGTSKVRTPRDTETRELQQALRAMAVGPRSSRARRIKRGSFRRAA